MLSLIGSLLLWLFVVYRLPTLRGSAVQRTMTVTAMALAALQTVHSRAVWETMVRAWGVETTSVVKQAVMLTLMATVLLFIRAVEARNTSPWPIITAFAVAGVLMAAPMPWARHGQVVVSYEDQAAFYASSWAWVVHWLVVLFASAWAMAVGVRFCVSYGLRAPQLPVRAGMILIGAGTATGLALVLTKAAVVVSGVLGFQDIWAGTGQQIESSLIMTGCGITFVGLCLTATGRGRLSLAQARAQRQALRRLEPLWTQLRSALPYIVLPTQRSLVLARRTGGQRERLYRKIVEIRDGLLILSSYAEPSTYAAAFAAAGGASLAPATRAATAHAVAVKVAIFRHGLGLRTDAKPASSLVLDESDFNQEVAHLVAVSTLLENDPLTAMLVHRILHSEVSDETARSS